jgi:carboxypeptidase Ss1
MFSLIDEAGEIEGEIIEIRRRLHENPELSYHEEETSSFIASKLRSLGIKHKTGIGGYGVVGLIEGREKGPCTGLRADMDALPVDELADIPFRSRRAGIMHACGHDTHVAMLLGAAMLIMRHRDHLKGTVKLIFQPAEEHGGLGGAEPMIMAGVMDKPKVDYIFGLHISSKYPSGSIALRPGPVMAAPDSFRIRITGKGGHGSSPHETIDPLYVGAELVSSLYGIRSRMIDPVEPFALSVCSFHSGTKDNIIADHALLEGTVRTFNSKTRRRAKSLVESISRSICASTGAKCEVKFMDNPYPVTENDLKATRKVEAILKAMKGIRIVEAVQIMGGEDFSRFLQRAPGTFYFLGTRNRKKGCVYPNHSSMFKVDEAVLKLGAASLAQIALTFGTG